MKSDVPAADSRAAVSSPKKIAFSLDARPHGSAIVLHCQGRLIFRNEAHALTTTVNEILPLARRMVLDLEGIEAVDSVGLGELVLLHMWAEAAGYSLKFSGPRRSVRNVLELTNVASVLDVYPSVPEAVAAMPLDELTA
jgi:anti-sigma B factor antagonist